MFRLGERRFELLAASQPCAVSDKKKKKRNLRSTLVSTAASLGVGSRDDGFQPVPAPFLPAGLPVQWSAIRGLSREGLPSTNWAAACISPHAVGSLVSVAWFGWEMQMNVGCIS